MFITNLTLNNFRSYHELSCEFLSQGACLIGDNGAGKTNIMEAIYFLSFGRSQRGALKKDMIADNEKEAFVEGIFEIPDNPAVMKLSIGFSRDKKVIVKRDNKKITFLSEWFSACNIISFGPQDIFLIYGEPAERRRFIDIILSQTDPSYLENLIMYKKNIQHRNKLLADKIHDTTISIYEEKCAQYGAYLAVKRSALFEQLNLFYTDYYNRIASRSDGARVEFKPYIKKTGLSLSDNEEYLIDDFKKRRNQDYAIGYSTGGPHRDDLICYFDNKQAKLCGSQGQCRSAAVALRLSALHYLEKVHKKKVIILADDAFTELDSIRMENIFTLLKNRGQLFITSTIQHKIFDDLPCYKVTRGKVQHI